MTGTTSEAMRLLVVVLIAGNVLGLFAGLSLLFAPRQVAQWLGWGSAHPLTVRRMTRFLEIPRDTQQALLRYPRVLGGALVAGGIFVLIKWIVFVSTISVAHGGRMLASLVPGRGWPAPVMEPLWVTLLVVALLGAVLAILVGGLALMRVETLKHVSSYADRWFSTRQAAKPFSRPYYVIDHLVAERPQVWGGVITLLSIYALGMIAWFARGSMH